MLGLKLIHDSKRANREKDKMELPMQKVVLKDSSSSNDFIPNRVQTM